jgi:acylphosphatase
MNKRLEAIVYGTVQGVYYRQYTVREARRLGLRGWVANQHDRTVRIVAEGQEKSLQEMARFLLQGSPGARVDHVKVDWLEATNKFAEFSVLHL